MDLETQIKDTYNTILSALTEYLTDEAAKIVADVEEDKRRFLRSWEAARVTAVKIQGVVGNDMATHEKNGRSGRLQQLMKKWCSVR